MTMIHDVGRLVCVIPLEEQMSSPDLDNLERANQDLVTAFCNAWAQRDVQLLLPYLSETIEYHMWDSENAIVVHGIEQFVETLTPFFESTERIEWEILRTQAMGKVVMNERHDRFCFGAGVADWQFPVVGVFIVEDGKIIHWKDYVTPGKQVSM